MLKSFNFRCALCHLQLLYGFQIECLRQCAKVQIPQNKRSMHCTVPIMAKALQYHMDSRSRNYLKNKYQIEYLKRKGKESRAQFAHHQKTKLTKKKLHK